MQEKVRKKLIFANKDSKTARIRQTKTNLCKIDQIRQKSARNWEPARIFFARQMTFKSSRIFQIWRRKPPSGNADTNRGNRTSELVIAAIQNLAGDPKNHRVNTNRGIDPGQPVVTPSARPATWCHVG
jgi:hypothetical protein